MKRVFHIGEVVWYTEDHERGWGKVGLINRSDEFIAAVERIIGYEN